MFNDVVSESIQELVEELKKIKRNWNGDEVTESIFNTLDIIYLKKPKPLLLKKKKYNKWWFMVFVFQPGTSMNEFIGKKEMLESATGKNIEMEKHGKTIQMYVYFESIPNEVKYSWNPFDEQYKDLYLPFPVGINKKGLLVVLDLAEGPHLLVAGLTKMGKSTLLRVAIQSLLLKCQIAILDLKKTSFNHVKNHCLLLKDEENAILFLRKLNQEYQKRIDILDREELEDIQEYNRKHEDNPWEYIIFIIDEYSQIKEEEIHYWIDELARLARGVGIHLIVATQRPDVESLKGRARSQFEPRICYKVADELNSRIVLGDSYNDAAFLPSVRGRCMFRFGSKLEECQTMNLTLAEAKNLIKKMNIKEVKINNANKQSTKRLLPR